MNDIQVRRDGDAPEKSMREEGIPKPGYLHRTSTAALEAENVRLREALTPSGDTKAAYHGEFRFDVMFPSIDEDDDEPVPSPVTVPWDTVKEIMAAISSRALAMETTDE